MEVQRRFGIVGKEEKWSQSYLANRQQYVEITHFYSNSSMTTCVVTPGGGVWCSARVDTGPFVVSLLSEGFTWGSSGWFQ